MKFCKIIGISLSLFILAGRGLASEPAYDKAWLKLLHYQENGGKYKGLVDNSEFYISPEGRNDPQKEMQAALAAFRTGKKKCEFPARFEWLRQQGLVTGDLADCQEYQQFLNDVQPNGITVLFTNAYMSNPASLFGHTLIRIDTARKGTQMLAHGINFGADSGTEYGFLFALKGLVGGYEGVYSISPYWDIINTYNNIENRDIWEYQLNLTAAEQSFLTAHLYEMYRARIRYYFLNKNCSYMILELLEAVRPELNLTKGYGWTAIPLDTLKTIKNEPNLVKETRYRPARYTKLKQRLEELSGESYGLFLKKMSGQNAELSSLTEQEEAAVLEALYEYYQYQYAAKEMELGEYRKKSFAVLRRRSQLPVVAEPEFSGQDPTQSHNSMQISVLGGIYNHQSFEQFELRPAYSALTDSAFGLVNGAEISVFSSSWRYYNQKHKTVLQSFTPLKIKSLVPAGRVFHPVSYAVNLEIKRAFNPASEEEGYVASAAMGVGKTYAIWNDVWLYGLFKVGGQYGGFIPGNQWSGFLPEVGLYKDFGCLRLHLSAEKTWASRRFGERLKYQVLASWGLSVNVSIDAAYNSSHNRAGKNQQEILAGIRYNF